MKIFLFAATLGGYNALPLEGDELKARVNFDYWARTSKTEHNIDQSNVPVKPVSYPPYNLIGYSKNYRNSRRDHL